MEQKHDLAKWFAGDMSQSEQLAFEQSADYAVYVKIQMYASRLEAPNFDENQLYNTIKSNRIGNKVISLQKSWVYKIAAILIVLLGMTFFIKSVATSTKSAANGRHYIFTLPDNSEVVLNAGSEVEYSMWNWTNNRNVKLLGEAYFKVSKGSKFEVETNLGKVSVLGTQFNVRARGERFEVACYEGRVKVGYDNNNEAVISKGKSVAVADGNAVIFKNHISEPMWMNNELTFTNERLPNILSELERQYNISIELKGINDNRLFTGTLPMKNMETCLKILSTVYHLKAVKVTKSKIILEAVDEQN